MGIILGNAVVDENGRASGGKPGDQKQNSSTNDTKGEVRLQSMYSCSKGWYILRPKTLEHANLIAEKMIRACNNANIGYNQSNRLGVIKYGTDTKVKTDCDCSSLVRACIKEATGVDPGNFSTAEEVKLLASTGLFEAKQEYVSQEKTPLYNGDVIVTKTKGHTAVVVGGNQRSTSSGYYPKYTGTSGSIVTALVAVGENDTSQQNRARIAAANGISNYSFTAEQNTQLVNLLKAGKLKRANGTASTMPCPVTVSCYDKYIGASGSIVEALKAVGENDTSKEHRAKIALANGISGYTGSAAQNNKLLNLLKSGALKKA